MPSGTSRTETDTHVTPLPTLGRTALLSGAFSLLPVFAVVLYLARTSPAWPVVLAVEAVVAVVFVVVYIRFRLVYSRVTRTHFVKRRMLLPQVSVQRTSIDRLLLHRVYRTGSTEALTQLLGVDSLGRRVLGMNALFWSEDDIQRVVEALDVQTTVDTLPMSAAEYHRRFPVARGWYLRWPVLIGAAAAALGVLVVVVLSLESVVDAS
ncbi:hypothetical protein [Frondihabitans peucedani]|jgi:hypothetical protein|uniref:PH domain-containing protein n=1 Tax=Frondihabitans peucedani TaxID=598626 RepID=A0ABP8DZX7_9MICO